MMVKGGDDNGTYIDCWNSLTESPCTDFPATQVDTSPDKKGGRLFLHHLPRAAETDVSIATGVCATNDGEISCYDFITGAYRNWGDLIENGLASPAINGGTHINHPPSNRLVLQAKDLNLCRDFDTQTSCGSVYAGLPFNDYGFAYEGNCIFALGHESLFHSFGMTDPEIANACPGTSSMARINTRGCAGGLTWPRVSFDFEFTPFTNFTVTLRDPNGNIVMGPVDMTDHPTGLLDLSTTSTMHEYLIIETVAVVQDGLATSPWDEDVPPEIFVGLNRLPHLVG
jgi:hypothetical protein